MIGATRIPEMSTHFLQVLNFARCVAPVLKVVGQSPLWP